MAQHLPLADAVQAAISASAHAAALDRLSATTEAVRRLGSLTSGRWRSAARDLERLEEDLQRALEGAAGELARHATALGVEEEALWTVGDAAATLDLLKEAALDELEEGAAAARLLQRDLIYGVTFLESDESDNRGTTLLFAWAEPLQPAIWHWEANWVQVDADADEPDDDADQELELYETATLEAGEPLVSAVAQALEAAPDEATRALSEAAIALTRASMLADEEDDEGEPDGTENGRGSL